MALTDFEQLNKLIDESKYILLVFAASGNGDATASALALKNILKQKQKQVDIAASGFAVPKNLKFLTGIETIQPELTHLQKFIIRVDVTKAPIDTLSYDVKDGWLSIYLTPKHGAITRNELRTAQSTFKYDLIITLGTPELESLGELFFNNTDLFYKAPIINIDHQSENERFGQINLIDVTAAATAEIIFHYAKTLPHILINEDIATALLAGMTVATKSFKQPHLAPHTLSAAGELVEHGADREKVVQHLYRTRSVAALKLWGQALSRLEINSELGLISIALNRDDFVKSGATPEDLHGIVEELLSTSPETKLSVILYEVLNGSETEIHALVTVDKNYNALSLLSRLNPTGNKRQGSVILKHTTLHEAENTIKKLIETQTHSTK